MIISIRANDKSCSALSKILDLYTDLTQLSVSIFQSEIYYPKHIAPLTPVIALPNSLGINQERKMTNTSSGNFRFSLSSTQTILKETDRQNHL